MILNSFSVNWMTNHFSSTTNQHIKEDSHHLESPTVQSNWWQCLVYLTDRGQFLITLSTSTGLHVSADQPVTVQQL